MADIHPPPPEPTTNGGGAHEALTLLPSSSSATATTAAKRQRRPSVRLGDIGEQPAALPPSDPFLRRAKLHLFPHPASSKNRSRNLITLAESPDDDKEDNIEALTSSFRKRNRDSISRRGWRFASAWTSNPDSGGDDAADEGFRSEFDDLRREDSSPRVRASEGDAPSESNGWDEEGGVRPWLNRLGLGRYAPVFEIHEVDDEVLPMLTLEDLKDMGINAVGSRRKMFYAIQKLKKNFT
ncbi:putative ankyrin repeat and SAM domain-containing protein 6 [Iris pallida]|uniref:Ankyrin repeat and SAM domain-containing protein 6 n=1 Tax=Iris pallida TaxID=29817 RepID=A0AAX6H8X1_IRIPA|nr:putative ankyrin repeat and SAM domain-containing protein 6 [Iris pallida]